MTPDELKARGLRVRPLEWSDPCKANNQTHIAKSIFGDYYVHVDGGRHQAWLEANEKPYENIIGPEVGYLREAQAAAEADHAARICAVLEPITPPVDASYVAGWMAARDAVVEIARAQSWSHTQLGLGGPELNSAAIEKAIRALTPPVASPTPPKTGTYIFPDSETPAQKATPPDVAQAARETLLKRLDEEIIADAFRDRRITDGRLADRLIRERGDAAAFLRAIAGETP